MCPRSRQESQHEPKGSGRTSAGKQGTAPRGSRVRVMSGANVCVCVGGGRADGVQVTNGAIDQVISHLNFSRLMGARFLTVGGERYTYE